MAKISIVPVDRDGRQIDNKCGMGRHLGGASLTLFHGKPNMKVPVRYHTGLTAQVHFGSCLGPSCGNHTPQVYKVVLEMPAWRGSAYYCISHHADTRGEDDKKMSVLKEISEKAMRLSEEDRYAKGLNVMQGPRLDTVQRVGKKLTRMAIARSSLSESEQSYDSLRDAIEEERRRVDDPRPVDPGMRSPAKIFLSPVNIDAFGNYLRLYCPDAIALLNTNQGVEVGYLDMSAAMQDSVKMQKGLFPVLNVYMIPDEELYAMTTVRGGIMLTRSPTPIVPAPIMRTIVPPLTPDKMCACQNRCTNECVLLRGSF